MPEDASHTADQVLAEQAMKAGFVPATPVPSTQPEIEPEGEDTEDDNSNASDTTEADADDFIEFDERCKEPFTGLLYVGYLEKTVHLYGHKFHIETPTQAQRLQVGPLIKEYLETMTGEPAYATAMLAAYLVTIDDQPLPEPILKNERDDSITYRFQWIMDNLRQPVINKLFELCMELDSDVVDVLDAMGKVQA